MRVIVALAACLSLLALHTKHLMYFYPLLVRLVLSPKTIHSALSPALRTCLLALTLLPLNF